MVLYVLETQNKCRSPCHLTQPNEASSSQRQGAPHTSIRTKIRWKEHRERLSRHLTKMPPALVPTAASLGSWLGCIRAGQHKHVGS